MESLETSKRVECVESNRDRLLTLEEAASILRTTPYCVRHYCKQGRLSVIQYKKPRGRMLVLESEVLRFRQTSTTRATVEVGSDTSSHS